MGEASGSIASGLLPTASIGVAAAQEADDDDLKVGRFFLLEKT